MNKPKTRRRENALARLEARLESGLDKMFNPDEDDELAMQDHEDQMQAEAENIIRDELEEQNKIK